MKYDQHHPAWAASNSSRVLEGREGNHPAGDRLGQAVLACIVRDWMRVIRENAGRGYSKTKLAGQEP